MHTIATLGSHSALDICRGAKDEGFKTLVIAEKGREQTYAKYYKTAGDYGCVDECLVLDKFTDVLTLSRGETIFVPHRSFEVYLNFDYEAIENKFKLPMFGNKFLLKIEERSAHPNQYDLLYKAGIRYPKHFSKANEIDRLVIVKAQQKKVLFERGFFFASSYQEYQREAQKKLESGLISEEGLKEAVIEEFVVGTPVNFNFFYSVLDNRLELMGTDTRRQTNLDGFLRLPVAQQQVVSQYLEVTFKEMGHIAVTLPESLIEEAMAIGERFVKVSGVIGPFALQALIRPIFPKLEIVVYDVSPRMPGSPGISATPYSSYLYGNSVSMGRRVAMEIREAASSNSISKITT